LSHDGTKGTTRTGGRCARLALGFVLHFSRWLHPVAWGCIRLQGLGSFCAGAPSEKRIDQG
jgi:hypothetical protein